MKSGRCQKELNKFTESQPCTEVKEMQPKKVKDEIKAVP